MGRKFASIDTTNKLLMLLLLPVVILILKELSNIFIPLIVACFFALLFMPFLRWSTRKRIPRILAVVLVCLVIFIVIRCCFWMLQLASMEFRSTDVQTWQSIFDSVKEFLFSTCQLIGLDAEDVKTRLSEIDIVSTLYENAGKVFNSVQKTVSLTFMSLFFLVLMLASASNGQRLLEVLLLNDKTSSMRTYITIEKSISKFILVKFLISLVTGVSFGVLCVCFHVKFAIFWGVLAFVLNFIQMIGSIISTAAMCLFALTQIPELSMVIIFIAIAIALQVLFGSILEPIFMGKTFSINTVTIIIMLFFWGYVWNIPGMILAVPLTVMVKTILEQFDKTKSIALLMS